MNDAINLEAPSRLGEGWGGTEDHRAPDYLFSVTLIPHPNYLPEKTQKGSKHGLARNADNFRNNFFGRDG